jgi:Flp pilus assembly protein TadG
VILALGFVVLLGLAALAIDVSRAYAEIRSDRSVADAASLAGAQELQIPGTRDVTPTEQVAARGLACSTAG